MKTQLKMADKSGAKWAIILGEVEVRENKAILRNMEKGKQEIISLDNIEQTIINILNEAFQYKPILIISQDTFLWLNQLGYTSR